jgi:pimeloyl-ACP methyl ester carboxylesterase
MYFKVDKTTTFAATGGQPFDPHQPTVVMVHGTGGDHRCWALQARWFAFHGYSVLIPNLPGHSLSAGQPMTNIEAMGQWLVNVLDQVGVTAVHLVGHSQGFLVALEAQALLGARLRSICAIATAAAIPVNPTLIETARTSPQKAVRMLLQWGFGHGAQMGLSAIPGMQPMTISQQIMAKNPVYEDFIACNEYHSGVEQARSVRVPAQVILAQQDRNTPLREGRQLAAELQVEPTVIQGTGHMLPMEAPKVCLDSMKQFIQSVEESR